MSHVLFLSYRMSKGFGVDLVISQLTERLQQRDICVSIGCMVTDGSYAHLKPFVLPPDAASVRRLAWKLQCDVLVAHSSPFFEILPALNKEFRVYAWEHGDPTPELRKDREASQRQKDHKKDTVYPNVHDVIAISKFIRKDIGWPKAKVIYNGCDHVIDQGSKSRKVFAAGKIIKIGGLMRLGAGESEYKGSALLVELFTILKNKYPVDLHIMGRGTDEDAKIFRDNGFIVHLNATNEQRDAYLRTLDIFVTTSLWEGFNLPLAEAQASGTLALASNRGAHPEICPLVFSDVKTAVRKIGQFITNHQKIFEQSKKSYAFVRSNFLWEKAAHKATTTLRLASNNTEGKQRRPGVVLILWFRIRLAVYFLRNLGLRLFLTKVKKRILG